MARIRSIKPEFWTSEQVMECSPIARLMFIGIWNFCDDHGRHPCSPKQIKALIFPSDEISVETIRRLFDELSTNGLVEIYSIDGKEYFQVTGWKHQKIDKPQPSKYPPRTSQTNRPVVEHSANGIDGEEGRGEDKKERKQEEEAAPAASTTVNSYAFEAGVIRLNQKDFDQWKLAYRNLNLEAELLALAPWAAEQRSWFNAVKGALTKRSRDTGLKLEIAKSQPESQPSRVIL